MMNYSRREELKAAIIHGLNHNQADRMLDSIIDCIENYESSVADMRVAIFRLKIDAKRLIRSCEENQDYLKQQSRENAMDAIAYSRQQRLDAMVHAGKAAP